MLLFNVSILYFAAKVRFLFDNANKGGGFFQRLVLTFITMKGSTHPFVEVYRPLEQPQNVGL